MDIYGQICWAGKVINTIGRDTGVVVHVAGCDMSCYWIIQSMIFHCSRQGHFSSPKCTLQNKQSCANAVGLTCELSP